MHTHSSFTFSFRRGSRQPMNDEYHTQFIFYIRTENGAKPMTRNFLAFFVVAFFWFHIAEFLCIGKDLCAHHDLLFLILAAEFFNSCNTQIDRMASYNDRQDRQTGRQPGQSKRINVDVRDKCHYEFFGLCPAKRKVKMKLFRVAQWHGEDGGGMGVTHRVMCMRIRLLRIGM